jgi:hypothetical protein
MVYRHGLGGLFAVLLGLLSHNAARADLLFVTNSGTIGEYTTAGATVNPALISGLSRPFGIAVSGSDLFVTNAGNDTIGQYTTGGATVNPTLISGLSNPFGIAVSGSDLFVVNAGSFGIGTIGQYTTAGATVNPALISGLSFPMAIAVSGSDLFVTNAGIGTIGAYTTSGATVNPALISGLISPYAIAIVPTVPEPGSGILTLFGLVLAGLAIKKIQQKSHNGCGWAYQCDEKTDTHGSHLSGLFGGGRPFAHFLGYGAPLLILMTAWAILLMYAA